MSVLKMEVNDFDDLTAVQFQNQDVTDAELKAANDHLLMKYFGNKIKHASASIAPQKKESFGQIKQWSSYLKPVVLSIVIVFLAILTKCSKVTQFLAFTSKELINNVILYGGLFVIVLVLVILV